MDYTFLLIELDFYSCLLEFWLLSENAIKDVINSIKKHTNTMLILFKN